MYTCGARETLQSESAYTGDMIERHTITQALSKHKDCFKGVVNCQNSQDKGPPEGNSARG